MSCFILHFSEDFHAFMVDDFVCVCLVRAHMLNMGLLGSGIGMVGSSVGMQF